MKKLISFIILAIILIVVVIMLGISNNRAKGYEIRTFNFQFEIYSGQVLYGADVMTIINNAINNNEKYDIEKDENGFYIENNSNSVKVDLILLSKDEEGNIEEKTYKMENLQKAGLMGFISNFSLTTFGCNNIEYNKEGRVCRITVKQLEL